MYLRRGRVLHGTETDASTHRLPSEKTLHHSIYTPKAEAHDPQPGRKEVPALATLPPTEADRAAAD